MRRHPLRRREAIVIAHNLQVKLRPYEEERPEQFTG
jgi:hypothetical protein